MNVYNKKGVTLIELIVTISIILIITSILVVDYSVFTTRSELRIKAYNVVEAFRLAQTISNSSALSFERSGKEVHEIENAITSEEINFQILRIAVREKKLAGYYIEEVKDIGFSTTIGGNKEFTNTYEAFYKTLLNKNNNIVHSNAVDKYKFIVAEDSAPKIKTCLLKELSSDENGVGDDRDIIGGFKYCNNKQKNSSIVNPIALTETSESYDIHIAIEHPTSEPNINIIPLKSSIDCDLELNSDLEGSAFKYNFKQQIPIPSVKSCNGSSSKQHAEFEGVRIYFIDQEDEFRFIEIHNTGLSLFGNV